MDTTESIKKKPKAKKVIKRKAQRREKSRGSLVVENIGEVGNFQHSFIHYYSLLHLLKFPSLVFADLLNIQNNHVEETKSQPSSRRGSTISSNHLSLNHSVSFH